jgi:site-specific recombinase XerD
MTTIRTQFIQQMQLKGYSKNSIQSYVDCLIGISKHYKISPDLLSDQQIRDYLQFCIVEKKLSTSYINQCVSALKILFVQVLKKEWDSFSIPRIKREKKLPVVLSKEEVKAVLNEVKNIKHRTILTLIYSAGLRVGEAIKIKVQDIDSNRMQIRIRQAKGAKDRYVVLSPVMLNLLRTYYSLYHPKDFLFPSQMAEQISDRTVQCFFKDACVKSRLNKKVSVHVLRHSFATHLMEQGVSLPIIQQLLGHKSLRTTSVYLHVQQYTIDKIKSPLDFL